MEQDAKMTTVGAVRKPPASPSTASSGRAASTEPLRLFDDADFGDPPAAAHAGHDRAKGGQRRAEASPIPSGQAPPPEPTEGTDEDRATAVGSDRSHHGDLAQRLVSVAIAARLLGIGRSTVYELIADGELHVVHINRSARISVSEIDAFVARLERRAEDRASVDIRPRPS
jgi:excisionase family DNA binding protein